MNYALLKQAQIKSGYVPPPKVIEEMEQQLYMEQAQAQAQMEQEQMQSMSEGPVDSQVNPDIEKRLAKLEENMQNMINIVESYIEENMPQKIASDKGYLVNTMENLIRDYHD